MFVAVGQTDEKIDGSGTDNRIVLSDTGDAAILRAAIEAGDPAHSSGKKIRVSCRCRRRRAAVSREP